MAEQSFPFENIDTTESQFSEWATNFQETGVQGSPTGTELGITVTGSDLNLTIAAGQAFIRGHYYINTDDLVLAVTSAGVNTRIDIVVVELDPEANTIVTKIVSGTAVSADPVAPTLTQSATGIYQLPIATLTIPTSTVVITSGMLTDTRTFMGNRVGIWTTATRPTDPTNYQTIGYNTTIEAHESWNGSAWVGFFDPISTAGDLVVGDATGQASRLGVGADGQGLTVVDGAPAWADSSGGAFYYQTAPGTVSTFDWAFDSAKSYGYFYYGARPLITIYDASDNLLATLPSSNDIQYILEQPADAAKIVLSTTGNEVTQVAFSEIIPTTPDALQPVFLLNTTQEVTLDASFTAYLIGGGGNGGNTTGKGSGGGGGGAGYIESGVITAGTYTATIGSAGGTTSIGSLTAAGGSAGGLGSGLANGADGGAGGSGGGGGGGAANGLYSPSSAGGGNGSDGANATGGGGPGDGGPGSGNEVVTSYISLLLGYGPPAESATGVAGFYRGGEGGRTNYPASAGINANNFGGGGGGAVSNTVDYENASGGTGFQGLILLVKVV